MHRFMLFIWVHLGADGGQQRSNITLCTPNCHSWLDPQIHIALVYSHSPTDEAPSHSSGKSLLDVCSDQNQGAVHLTLLHYVCVCRLRKEANHFLLAWLSPIPNKTLSHSYRIYINLHYALPPTIQIKTFYNSHSNARGFSLVLVNPLDNAMYPLMLAWPCRRSSSWSTDALDRDCSTSMDYVPRFAIS
jgi:hypothetical protein